jgi:3-phosphoglycerate kinase
MKKYDSLDDTVTMKLRTLTSSACNQKTVLIRTDYNVPLKKHGATWVVANDNRIKASLETLQFLVAAGAKVVVISHLGRPKGEPNPDLSLAPVAHQLAKLIEAPVKFVPEIAGNDGFIDRVQAHLATQPAGSILVLENLRFHPGEKKNFPDFAKDLAAIADIFVNEAFSAAHRAHASMVGIPKYLESYAGFAFQKEVDTLNELMTNPQRPFVMVIGGAKISDKVGAVTHLAAIADAVLIGGGTANNFLAAEGINISKSYLEETTAADDKKRTVNYVDVAEQMIESTRTEKMLLDGYIPLPKLMMPIDVIAAPTMDSTDTQVVDLTNGEVDFKDGGKNKGVMYLDIGPKTVKLFQQVLLQAGTIFWNGPMGVFEKKAFETGTAEIARTIAKSGAKTIIGGGDTIAAATLFDLSDRFDYVSAAGGAALEFLSGEMLPGVEPLLKK